MVDEYVTSFPFSECYEETNIGDHLQVISGIPFPYTVKVTEFTNL